MASANSSIQRPLRRGDVVEVRSPAEILATLDGDARDRVPFMPEMLRHAGRRYTVSRRVDKICDTVTATGSRRMTSTVFLEDLRCDGSAHGGCQAGCRLYWKEAWLRLVDADAEPEAAPVDGPSPALEAVAEAGTRTVREGESEEVWRCQATEALKFTEQARVFKDPDQYWREFNNGNRGRVRFIALFIRAFVMEIALRLGLIKGQPLRGPEPKAPPTEPLNLQPGEVVEVRSAAEIEATLDDRGFNRGLSFDREMVRYCGQTLRVKERVTRLINENTGHMLHPPRDCILLEGPVCSGECSTGRWFCPREVYPFWREAWLRRVEAPVNGAPQVVRVGVSGGDGNGSTG